MSFPASFGSQLTAVMEALLKAVVAEVTALVEDGAVELRLELRERDREIREKQREIEQRDRDILELRAAVEELRGRDEAAVSPGEEERSPEQTESCSQQVWTKEEDSDPVVKREPDEDFTPEAEPDLHSCLWPPSPLPAAGSTADTNASAALAAPADTCAYEAGGAAQNYHAYYSEAGEDFSPSDQADLSLDSLLNENQEQFLSQKPGFYQFPVAQIRPCNGLARRRSLSGKTLGPGELRCDLRCDQCGKTFTAKKRLMSHQSVHTGAKPFSCRMCGKVFSRQDNCVRHEKSHR
ncbi:uncharacterized protein [Eucyclogobius newberryi]|uniref:uncharacterized protein n=1 Tax=Eucyclogobius newberryi TaxID=166745 RepID=UPI003B5B7D06